MSVRRPLGVAAVAISGIDLGLMVVDPDVDTFPFAVACVVLALVSGFRFAALRSTPKVLVASAVCTGLLIAESAMNPHNVAREVIEIPIIGLLVRAVLWYAFDLHQTLKQLRALADERADLLDRQQRLLHDVSHELRTPVTIARGHLEVLPDAPAEVAVAVDELGRLGRIIDQLLLLSRLESARFEELVDVEDFLEEAFLRWASVAPRSYRLGTIAPGLLRADPEALRIAVDELLSNAVGHTADADRVELRAHEHAEMLVIEVADDGPGIPTDALDRIFTRAERVGSERRSTGLGLAIVTGIAEAHGGRCTVRSSPAGSTFSLSLPGFEPAMG